MNKDNLKRKIPYFRKLELYLVKNTNKVSKIAFILITAAYIGSSKLIIGHESVLLGLYIGILVWIKKQ